MALVLANITYTVSDETLPSKRCEKKTYKFFLFFLHLTRPPFSGLIVLTAIKFVVFCYFYFRMT